MNASLSHLTIKKDAELLILMLDESLMYMRVVVLGSAREPNRASKILMWPWALNIDSLHQNDEESAFVLRVP